MGDIPGIAYTTPPGTDASGLPGFGAEPEVHRYEYEASTLWWTYSGYSSDESHEDDDFYEDTRYGTSASPAHEHASRSRQERDASIDQLRASLAQTLELPGEPSDYHFAIQQVVHAMYSRRSQGPHALAEMEEIAWLDINLIQAAPEAVRYANQGEVEYFSVAAFARLLDLYGREGLLADAVYVADIAERFGVDKSGIETLRARAAAVSVEDQAQQA